MLLETLIHDERERPWSSFNCQEQPKNDIEQSSQSSVLYLLTPNRILSDYITILLSNGCTLRNSRKCLSLFSLSPIQCCLVSSLPHLCNVLSPVGNCHFSLVHHTTSPFVGTIHHSNKINKYANTIFFLRECYWTSVRKLI